MEVEKLREKLEITGSEEELSNEETIDETILSENSLTYRKRFEVSPKFQYITIEEENLRNDAENIINSDYTLLNNFNIVAHDDGQKNSCFSRNKP